MRVHQITIRVSDKDGLWAELLGHDGPAPSMEADGKAVAGDAEYPCERRDCDRPTTRILQCHRAHSRREQESVGLCELDFNAHRSGESFLVHVLSNR